MINKLELRYVHNYSSLILMMATVLVTGCAAQQQAPDFKSPNFDMNSIESIGLLPHLDYRVDQSTEIPNDQVFDEHRMGPGSTIEYFEKVTDKKAVAVHDYDLVKKIVPEMLAPPQSMLVELLSSDSNRFKLLFVLDDAMSKKGFFSSKSSSECRGFLIDQELGEVVWRDTARTAFSIVGPVGWGSASDTDLIANQCFRDLILALPLPR